MSPSEHPVPVESRPAPGPADEHAEDTTAVPLLHPREGVPPVVTTEAGVRDAAERLAAGSGPLAVDAERASGFRYSARAYLVQLRRHGSGTVLLDPIAVPGALTPLAEAINPLEWVLHSADQDLPCLAELGLRPTGLFDTELAGRLAGFERVGLAAIVERTLGYTLLKGHGAADWSSRPLPDDWLNYAALDVEVLVELRDAMAAELESQGKISWAAEEFESVRTSGPPAPKPDRWRRTSGIHTIKSRRTLAAIRELWLARDQLAERRDIAPGRVLPDRAIVDAATADPKTIGELRARPVFGGPRQRRHSSIWLSALERARTLPDSALPPLAQPFDGPPPANRWPRKDPAAAERLRRSREALALLSENVHVPVENLLAPDTVRRLCWSWHVDGTGASTESAVDDHLAAAGARHWQRELTTAPLAAAMTS